MVQAVEDQLRGDQLGDELLSLYAAPFCDVYIKLQKSPVVLQLFFLNVLILNVFRLYSV